MRKIILIIFVVFFGLYIFVLHPRLTQEVQAPGLDLGQVTFKNGKAITVELPKTNDDFRLGLGGRDSLDDDSGMLFVFADKDRHGFWMKGMKFPIDILWIDGDTIVHIEENVPPAIMPLKTYIPNQPANLVLEVQAGFVAENNIQLGESVQVSY